ncbi:type 4a pilus biogenesis protein PilO [Neobacillus drentensis]|uniref:type 4a pilus biogenesis protein PilO n=1 Tax=Neobacillus drentensis TaxID=220684 RepID=UPI001F4717A1|nr:type 4a pilus biogenesis protein PilO [Neobacillus drentensis]ULT55831.1 type 4a pilus biogenesis protein PilO [Neobacillus drentensis]
MKFNLSKIDKIIVGSGAVLIVIVFVYSQFFSLSPLKSDLSIKEQALKSEQKLLEVVSQKKSDTNKSKPENTVELQKRVPVEPLQEQFILDLEKAETVSNSKIKTMSFSKDVAVTVATDQTTTQTTTTNQSDAATTATTQSTTSTTTTDQSGTQQQAATPYSGLKKLTVQLSVESSTYQNLEKFIQTIESLPRIVSVEAINYTGEKEVTSLETETQPLTYSLTVSTFYMPSLTDLQADLPKMDSPAPAGKENPLSQYPATATTQP